MQYVDNNMDDLFRKAANEYPLKSPEPDWNKLEKALQSQTGNNTSLPLGKKKKDGRKFLWLFLLLPLGFICTHNLNSGLHLTGTSKTVTFLQATQHATNKNISLPNDGKPVISYNSNNDGEQSADNKPNIAQTTKNPENISALNNDISFRKKIKDITYDQPMTYGNPISGSDPLPNQQTPERNHQLKTESNISLPKNSLQNDALLQKNKDSLAFNKKATTKITEKNKKGQRGFYISILGAADVSTIKMQTIEHIGFSAGVLLAYQFNRKWAIEGGMFWNKKQYYSKGEYFDKSKTNIPSYVQIIDMDGNCNMFEIPVNVRYNFSYKKSGVFFATAGLSSYLMKKENYAYSAEAYGNYYDGKKSYSNSGNNWLSILNVSAGYEYKLGKIGSLRAEPYIKLPLKGVGIGNLPISSVGLNVGITHHFR